MKAIEGPQWRREESEPPPARQRVLAARTRPRACDLVRGWVQRANLMAACEERVSGALQCLAAPRHATRSRQQETMQVAEIP